MRLYQVKDLDGTEGLNGGYWEYEFCIENKYRPTYERESNIVVTFGTIPSIIDKEVNSYDDRNHYSVRKVELNELGEF